MQIGSFQLDEPVPELRNPHVIASLRPWVDAGSVGTLSLGRLERHMNARDLGSLESPGRYFDFTRYRPVMYNVEGQRQMTVPNTILRYGVGPASHDFIFLHMLEPHSFAEEYIESIVEVLKHFNIARYCRVGGMYDAVPHTRPLLVMGNLNGEPLTVDGVSRGRNRAYQGPTSIMNIVGEKITASDIENMTLMVRLPQYVQLDEDRTGAARLLEVLSSVYDLPDELGTSRRGVRQYERVSAEIERNPGVQTLVSKLEADYDARMENAAQEQGAQEETPETSLTLPPLVEEFLRGLGSESRGDGDSQDSER